MGDSHSAILGIVRRTGRDFFRLTRLVGILLGTGGHRFYGPLGELLRRHFQFLGPFGDMRRCRRSPLARPMQILRYLMERFQHDSQLILRGNLRALRKITVGQPGSNVAALLIGPHKICASADNGRTFAETGMTWRPLAASSKALSRVWHLFQLPV
jgi:hypothetical protein